MIPTHRSLEICQRRPDDTLHLLTSVSGQSNVSFSFHSLLLSYDSCKDLACEQNLGKQNQASKHASTEMLQVGFGAV